MNRYDLISKIDTSAIAQPIDTFSLDDLVVIAFTQAAQAKLNLGLPAFAHCNIIKKGKVLVCEKPIISSEYGQ